LNQLGLTNRTRLEFSISMRSVLEEEFAIEALGSASASTDMKEKVVPGRVVLMPVLGMERANGSISSATSLLPENILAALGLLTWLLLSN